jgi:GTP cyclohydrolase II
MNLNIGMERISAEVEPQESFAGYVRTKQEKIGHILDASYNK